MAGDPHHQRGKDQGRDDGLDQAEKYQAQHARVHRDIGEVVAKLRARNHRYQNPRCERASHDSVSKQRTNRQPAHDRQWHGMNLDQPEVVDGGEKRGNSDGRGGDKCKFAFLGGVGVRHGKNQRSRSSSSMLWSVFWSRYFTITGVYNDKFHSAALPLLMARAPGTTTAFSGTARGRSRSAR